MTFDDAIKLAKSDYIYDDNSQGLWTDVLEELQQEYAPTINMTKSEYDFIFPLIKKGKEMGATFTEFWSVYKDDRNREHLKPIFETQEKAMLIWLYPETIKVIGENNDTATSGRNKD